MADSDDTPKESKKEVLSDKERVDKGELLARVIIEVLGAPKDYVEEAIGLVIDRIHKTKDVEVVSESTYEAEEKGKLFSSFSEIEIWFKDMDTISKFLFDFTPSSIEMMQPKDIAIDANFITGFFNDFLLKMHDLGLKLKDLSANAQILNRNTDTLVRNFFNVVLKEPMTSDELSKIMGIPPKNIEAILAQFLQVGIIEKEGDKYSLKK